MERIAAQSEEVRSTTTNPEMKKLAQGQLDLILNLINLNVVSALVATGQPTEKEIPPRLTWRERWRLFVRAAMGR